MDEELDFGSPGDWDMAPGSFDAGAQDQLTYEPGDGLRALGRRARDWWDQSSLGTVFGSGDLRGKPDPGWQANLEPIKPLPGLFPRMQEPAQPPAGVTASMPGIWVDDNPAAQTPSALAQPNTLTDADRTAGPPLADRTPMAYARASAVEPQSPADGSTSPYVPIGGSMAGRRFDSVPTSGGAPNSREWGGPRRGGRHAGIDIPGQVGDPVYMAPGGEVIRSGQGQGYGNYVDVRAPDGTVHRMGHLNSIAPGMTPGARLDANAQVGALGHTGNASASFPHAHYEVFPDQAAYDRAAGQSSRASWRERSDPRQWFANYYDPLLQPSAGLNEVPPEGLQPLRPMPLPPPDAPSEPPVGASPADRIVRPRVPGTAVADASRELPDGMGRNAPRASPADSDPPKGDDKGKDKDQERRLALIKALTTAGQQFVQARAIGAGAGMQMPAPRPLSPLAMTYQPITLAPVPVPERRGEDRDRMEPIRPRSREV